jgi:hypothetical protein
MSCAEQEVFTICVACHPDYLDCPRLRGDFGGGTPCRQLDIPTNTRGEGTFDGALKALSILHRVQLFHALLRSPL